MATGAVLRDRVGNIDAKGDKIENLGAPTVQDDALRKGRGEIVADDIANVTRELFLPANEAYINAGTPDDYNYRGTVRGGANTDDPILYFSFPVPDDFVSFTKMEIVWFSAAAAGNARMVCLSKYCADGEDQNTHSDTPAQGQVATAGANLLNVTEPANPLTLANLAIGDHLGIYFIRQGSHVDDTLDDSMYVCGLLFTYTANR